MTPSSLMNRLTQGAHKAQKPFLYTNLNILITEIKYIIIHLKKQTNMPLAKAVIFIYIKHFLCLKLNTFFFFNLVFTLCQL